MDDETYTNYWQGVRLTDDEIERMCDLADAGDARGAQRVVDGAYERLLRDAD